ncbi:MAG: hypothetical protein E6J64_20755 [Deltaproteobacteria bacterium]|nr:MAG: hypothetical protein E6J64_20755 [Deltaproteobacteria bacterium]
MSSLLVALAAVWLAAAFHLLRDPCGPVALLPALALGLAAAVVRRRDPLLPAQIVLGAGLAGALAMHFFFPPAELPFPRLAGYRGFAVMGLVLASAYLCLHLRASLQRARFLLLVACFVVLALAAAPSWSWTFEAVELMFAGLFLGQLGGSAPQLAAGLMLFTAPLGAPYGVVAAAVLAVWSAVLYGDRSARWPHLVAPLAGSAFCAVGLLWPGSVCEVPALGVGLFSAAAALEGMS